MKSILLLALLTFSFTSNGQFTVSLCEFLRDADHYRTTNKIDSLRLDEKNEDGSYKTISIPARFAETSFRKFSDTEYAIRYFAYGKEKQIRKLADIVLEEIKMCYPNYTMEVGEFNSETFIKYFYCHPSEEEGSQVIGEYEHFAFKLIIQYRKKEHSLITLSIY